jgi:hypothetical protein
MKLWVERPQFRGFASLACHFCICVPGSSILGCRKLALRIWSLALDKLMNSYLGKGLPRSKAVAVSLEYSTSLAYRELIGRYVSCGVTHLGIAANILCPQHCRHIWARIKTGECPVSIQLDEQILHSRRFRRYKLGSVAYKPCRNDRPGIR